MMMCVGVLGIAALGVGLAAAGKCEILSKFSLPEISFAESFLCISRCLISITVNC